mmetsp:Transcript_8715/g.19764  ORF Transcript_8715/g.19764 Transcript_8715/m.19764 type:complete len:297 (+) Transcript_8715:487-1377(+)
MLMLTHSFASTPTWHRSLTATHSSYSPPSCPLTGFHSSLPVVPLYWFHSASPMLTPAVVNGIALLVPFSHRHSVKLKSCPYAELFRVLVSSLPSAACTSILISQPTRISLLEVDMLTMTGCGRTTSMWMSLEMLREGTSLLVTRKRTRARPACWQTGVQENDLCAMYGEFGVASCSCCADVTARLGWPGSSAVTMSTCCPTLRCCTLMAKFTCSPMYPVMTKGAVSCPPGVGLINSGYACTKRKIEGMEIVRVGAGVCVGLPTVGTSLEDSRSSNPPAGTTHAALFSGVQVRTLSM